MITNTKTLFAGLLKAAQADCICDIGSRDGVQSILFRRLRPTARVLAFEANPINFADMAADPRLKQEGVEIFPYAISDQEGFLEFFVADVDYSNPEENRGTSSLFKRPQDKIKEVVKVETHRIDQFLRERYPDAKRVCLWIDAEGAEYMITQGASGLKDRLFALHVETANFEMVPNQHLYPELAALFKTFGFVPCGNNITPDRNWGDVVFIREDWQKSLGFRFTIVKWKAYLSYWLKADSIAVRLKSTSPPLYQFLHRLFVKFT
jgi:FkbM family methyltransferase